MVSILKKLAILVGEKSSHMHQKNETDKQSESYT